MKTALDFVILCSNRWRKVEVTARPKSTAYLRGVQETHLWHGTQTEAHVGRETLGAVYHLTDFSVVQSRNPME